MAEHTRGDRACRSHLGERQAPATTPVSTPVSTAPTLPTVHVLSVGRVAGVVQVDRLVETLHGMLRTPGSRGRSRPWHQQHDLSSDRRSITWTDGRNDRRRHGLMTLADQNRPDQAWRPPTSVGFWVRARGQHPGLITETDHGARPLTALGPGRHSARGPARPGPGPSPKGPPPRPQPALDLYSPGASDRSSQRHRHPPIPRHAPGDGRGRARRRRLRG